MAAGIVAGIPTDVFRLDLVKFASSGNELIKALILIFSLMFEPRAVKSSQKCVQVYIYVYIYHTLKGGLYTIVVLLIYP